jgi:uncharacterized membrane protein YtjA (UPF0391 family)
LIFGCVSVLKVGSGRYFAESAAGTSPAVPRSFLAVYGYFAMLSWALTFLILALVAGYLGFFGLAGLAASIAKILLVVFLVLLFVSALSNALRGRAPPM